KLPDASAFDCIVVDISLPKMNGLQLQEEINRTVPFASIVFITGHSDLSLGVHAMRKGAVDFLEKPIDDETLLSSIARGADLSRKRRAAHLQHNELEKRYVAILPGAIIGLSAADKKPAFSLLWVTTLPGLTSAPTTRESCPI